MFFSLGVTSFSKGVRSSPSLLWVLFMNFFNKGIAGWNIDPLLFLGWANWLLGNAAFQRLSSEIWALVLNSSAFLRHGGGQGQGPTAMNTDTVLWLCG